MSPVMSLECRVSGKGLHEITASVSAAVARLGIAEGLCTLYIAHTSASLLIQENADPSVQRDLSSPWVRGRESTCGSIAATGEPGAWFST